MGHYRHAALLQKQFEIVIDQFGCEPEGGADIRRRAGMPRNELHNPFGGVLLLKYAALFLKTSYDFSAGAKKAERLLQNAFIRSFNPRLRARPRYRIYLNFISAERLQSLRQLFKLPGAVIDALYNHHLK